MCRGLVTIDRGQVEDCEARIEERGAQVGEVPIDSGRSAWNPRMKRPDWERLMSGLEAGLSIRVKRGKRCHNVKRQGNRLANALTVYIRSRARRLK